VRFRLPREAGQVDPSVAAPGVDLNYDIGGARPATVADVLLTARYLRTAYSVELRIDGDHAATIGELPRVTIAEYGLDELIFEQYADDLAIIQRHTRTNFNMPQTVTPEDRVYARVARLLIEGEIVAAPDVTTFTRVMTGGTTPGLRNQLPEPGFAVWRAADPYTVDIDGREFVIGDIYAIHPRATAVNAEEAIAALDGGTSEGFQVRYRPGDDPYFYLALANRPATDIPGKQVRLWGLIGINQPGIDPASEPE
jgi:hypothetical protein